MIRLSEEDGAQPNKYNDQTSALHLRYGSYISNTRQICRVHLREVTQSTHQVMKSSQMQIKISLELARRKTTAIATEH